VPRDRGIRPNQFDLCLAVVSCGGDLRLTSLARGRLLTDSLRIDVVCCRVPRRKGEPLSARAEGPAPESSILACGSQHVVDQAHRPEPTHGRTHVRACQAHERADLGVRPWTEAELRHFCLHSAVDAAGGGPSPKGDWVVIVCGCWLGHRNEHCKRFGGYDVDEIGSHKCSYVGASWTSDCAELQVTA